MVLLDIGLPGMDGYEVARSLRTEMGDTTPMLVAMTGYGQHEVSRHSQKAEFDHHLVKPADLGALRELLTLREMRKIRCTASNAVARHEVDS